MNGVPWFYYSSTYVSQFDVPPTLHTGLKMEILLTVPFLPSSSHYVAASGFCSCNIHGKGLQGTPRKGQEKREKITQ
jgi:hypothetical protein